MSDNYYIYECKKNIDYDAQYLYATYKYLYTYSTTYQFYTYGTNIIIFQSYYLSILIVLQLSIVSYGIV